MSKRFLVKDSLPTYKWEMSSETKNIGNYTCYKASFTRDVENVKMSIVNGESKEVKETVSVTTTAWYTPQIPINQGPDDFWGLPGLILEVNADRTTILCTKIVMNPEEKEMIEKALVKHRGKRKYAAKELGISERTLYRKIKEYDL